MEGHRGPPKGCRGAYREHGWVQKGAGRVQRGMERAQGGRGVKGCGGGTEEGHRGGHGGIIGG